MEAIGAGLYTAPTGNTYQRIHILTIEQLLADERPRYLLSLATPTPNLAARHRRQIDSLRLCAG